MCYILHIICHAASQGVTVVSLCRTRLSSVVLFLFFFDRAEVGPQLWRDGRREGIEGAGQRLAKSDKGAVGRRGWREKWERERKRASQGGWRDERVTRRSVCYRKKRDSKRG